MDPGALYFVVLISMGGSVVNRMAEFVMRTVACMSAFNAVGVMGDLLIKRFNKFFHEGILLFSYIN